MLKQVRNVVSALDGAGHKVINTTSKTMGISVGLAVLSLGIGITASISCAGLETIIRVIDSHIEDNE